MMSPECQSERFIVAIAGPNSTGKSELARQIGHALRAPETDHRPSVPTRVLHIGDIFRFCASLPGGFLLDTPEQIEASACEALEHVRCEVDPTTGEIFFRPNGIDRFTQTAHNGVQGSIGSNPHLSEFVKDFVGGVIQTHFPNNAIGIIDGRERWGASIWAHTAAKLPIRTQFFYQERPEVGDWPIEKVQEVILERDGLDRDLTERMAVEPHEIDVIRTETEVSATQEVARQMSGIIFDRYASSNQEVSYSPVRLEG